MRERWRWFLFENILRPLFLPIYWLVNGTYRVLFGWLDVRASKAKEREFALQIRGIFSFLFEAQDGLVVPNVGIPFPEPFDYATVTVACHNLLIRFVRGRGELNVALAQSKAPDNWHDLLLVMAAIDGRSELPERRWITELNEAAALLEPNMARLYDAFGSDSNGETARRLEEFHRADRASMREWEFEINNRIR